VPEVRRNLLLNIMVQGEIPEADTPTILVGATPSGLISDSFRPFLIQTQIFIDILAAEKPNNLIKRESLKTASKQHTQ